MTLTYACIASHGGEVIPKLAGPGEKRFLRTREGMRTLAKKIVTAKPDTIVIASPHNLRLVRHIAVVVSKNSTGTLRTSPGREVGLKAKCDVELAGALLRAGEGRGLPVVGANYGTSEGSTSDVAMDWGTLVPLWFVLNDKRLKPKIVIVAPSREIPLRQNIEFGTVSAKVFQKTRRRIVFIASADQAHTHAKSGPYGFHKAASQFDRMVIRAIENNRMDSLMRIGSRMIEHAKPDSLWQIAILVGILRQVKMKPTLVSYEVPTYYGMICASFERVA